MSRVSRDPEGWQNDGKTNMEHFKERKSMKKMERESIKKIVREVFKEFAIELPDEVVGLPEKVEKLTAAVAELREKVDGVAGMKLTLMEKLRLIRHRNKWSQRQLAQRLDVELRTLRAWEQGCRTPASYFVPHLQKFVEDNAESPNAREIQAGKAEGARGAIKRP